MFPRFGGNPSKTRTTKDNARNSSPAPISNSVKSQRSGTVADRIKQFNARATQAQAEIAQEQLLRSRPTTPRNEYVRSSVPASPRLVPIPTPSHKPARDDILNLSTAVRRYIPGDWPMEDKPVRSDAPVLPLFKQAQPTRVDALQKPSGAGLSIASAPVSPLFRAVPGPTQIAPLELKHREMLSFQVPAGPRTEYAYEHHHRDLRQEGRSSSDYNPYLPQQLVIKSPPRLWQPQPRQVDDLAKMTPAVRERPTSAHEVDKFSETDPHTAWAKFRSLDHGGKRIESTRPPSLIQPFTPPRTITPSTTCFDPRCKTVASTQEQQRPINEGAGNPILTIAAKGTGFGDDVATEVISRVPLSRTAAPQATLTLAVSNMPQAFVQIQSSKVRGEVQTVIVPGRVPPAGRNTATSIIPGSWQGTAAGNADHRTEPTPSNGAWSTTSASNLPNMFHKEGPVGCKADYAHPSCPPPNQDQQQTDLQLTIPTICDMFDTIILEHRSALTSISRKLATELRRLEADYESVLLPIPETLPDSDAAVWPEMALASIPEPHHTIVLEVMPDLAQQARRMQELVDEIVRHAREVWCVDLSTIPCRCLEGWDAKVLQIRREQRERARRMQMWVGLVVEEPRPLHWSSEDRGTGDEAGITLQQVNGLERFYGDDGWLPVLSAYVSRTDFRTVEESYPATQPVELRTWNPSYSVFPDSPPQASSPSFPPATTSPHTPPLRISSRSPIPITSPPLLPPLNSRHLPELLNPDPIRTLTPGPQHPPGTCWNDTGLLTEYGWNEDTCRGPHYGGGFENPSHGLTAATPVVACLA